MRGEDVSTLQRMLISKGYTLPSGVTGYFGNETKAAVTAYQVAHGIVPARGYFGTMTRTHMMGTKVE
jgi:peptidoglycan hydrolase-like protein with peptidoglycan-binding domain